MTTRTFGVSNAYGSLRRVLMHRPENELDVVTIPTAKDFHFDGPVNREAFLSDYDAMLRLFNDHGVETLLLRDVLKGDSEAMAFMDHRPNMTYTRDLAAVFKSGAVLMNPYLRGRWWDQWVLGRAFQKLGIPILGSIESPGYLEGGGVTIIGDDTVVASLCDRANEVGTRMLRDLVLANDFRYFLEVALPSGHIHIDGIFMMLDQSLCLIHPESLRVFPSRLYDRGAGEPRYLMFEEFLESRGIRSIPITLEERQRGHLNVVVTQRSRRAIGFAGAVRIGAEMAKHGWQLDTFPADELIKGKGGAHCMTCPVLVD